MHQRLRVISVLITMAFGLGMFTLSATAGDDNSDLASSAAPRRFDEVSRTFQAPDGTLKEVMAVFDPSIISEGDVLESILGPNLPPAPEVSAAYVASRRWAAQDIPVVVRYNDDFDPPDADGAPAAAWAMNTWNAVTNNTFAWEIGAPTSSVADADCVSNVDDGINSVRFSTELDDGVLGVTCSSFISQGGKNTTYEFDMQYDYWTYWSVNTPTPNNKYDLYTVMLHEFGHALGLSHSSNGTVMQPYLDTGEQLRVLQADDIAGLRALYPVAAEPTATHTATSVPPTATRTPTLAPQPTATRVPRPNVNHPFKLFAAQAATEGEAVTPPPAATATPTPTTTIQATATPTQTGTQTPTNIPAATATPTNIPAATATPTQVPQAGLIARNSTWRVNQYTGSVYVMGEVFNGTNAAVEFVKVTANFYSAGGTLLATDWTYADVTTIAAGADSPFWVILLNPPSGIDSVIVSVSDYNDDPYFSVVTGMTLQVTNVYTTIIDSLHIVGTVTNNSGRTWDYVQPIVAIYDAQGRVVETDFAFTNPTTLAPGQSGTFDLLIIDGAHLEFAPKRFWVEANED